MYQAESFFEDKRMMDYFSALEKIDINEEVISLTVISGEAAGEKAVVSSGKPIFFSDPEGFLKKHERQWSKLSGSGIISVDGEELYYERIGQRKKLVICGCGHVSIPIIRLGKMIGFYVTAIDDRPEFAKKAAEAGADEVFRESFPKALENIPGDPFTWFVIVTRGHLSDMECLSVISGKKHAYIGMVGSKRKVALVKEELMNEGVDQSVLENLHAPIGLKIGAETPEEIAVAVLAEMIELKNKNPDHPIPDDILAAIKETEGSKVLATIVRREGSAPRGVGSKMLFTKERAVNTIGGGILEARVREKAMEILASGTQKPRLLQLKLNAAEASAEGSICGGIVDVFLETI